MSKRHLLGKKIRYDGEVGCVIGVQPLTNTAIIYFPGCQERHDAVFGEDSKGELFVSEEGKRYNFVANLPPYRKLEKSCWFLSDYRAEAMLIDPTQEVNT